MKPKPLIRNAKRILKAEIYRKIDTHKNIVNWPLTSAIPTSPGKSDLILQTPACFLNPRRHLAIEPSRGIVYLQKSNGS